MDNWWQVNRIWIKRTVLPPTLAPSSLNSWPWRHFAGSSVGSSVASATGCSFVGLSWDSRTWRWKTKETWTWEHVRNMWFLWQSSPSIQYMNESETYLSSWRREKHGNDSGCNAIYYVQLVIICIYENRYIDWYQEWAIHKIVYILCRDALTVGKWRLTWGMCIPSMWSSSQTLASWWGNIHVYIYIYKYTHEI